MWGVWFGLERKSEKRRWRPPWRREGGWDRSKRGMVRLFQIELWRWWIGFMQRWRRCLTGQWWGGVRRWGRQSDLEGGGNKIERRWSDPEEDKAIKRAAVTIRPSSKRESDRSWVGHGRRDQSSGGRLHAARSRQRNLDNAISKVRSCQCVWGWGAI